MYKKMLGVALLASTFALSPAVFAKSCVCGEGFKQMISDLKLDSAQKDKIQPILDQMGATMKANGTQMDDIAKQLHDQVVSDKMDQATVDGLVDKKTKLIGDMMKAKLSAKSQIFAVLTPQQKNELQTKMDAQEEKIANEFKSCHPDD